jgi:hypothetical protein
VTTRWDIEHAVRDSALPADARHVLLDLLTRTQDGGTAIPAEYTPSLTGLARSTGRSRRTVMRALNVLESGGWLSRHRDPERARKEGKPTSYRPKLPARARAALGASDGETLGLGTDVPQARDRGRDRARATVTPNQNYQNNQNFARTREVDGRAESAPIAAPGSAPKGRARLANGLLPGQPPDRPGTGECPVCRRFVGLAGGGRVKPHPDFGTLQPCPGAGQPPVTPVPCLRCGRTGQRLWSESGLCKDCHDAAARAESTP